MKRLLPLMFLPLLPASLTADEPRIVSAGGSVTEIFYELGLESHLVGVDASSVYPEVATELPQVGYARALSAEGILSLNPTHLVCQDDAGPPAVIDQIERVGVEVIRLPSEPEIENIEESIRAIGETFDVTARGEELIVRLHEELAAARQEERSSKPRVLFIYARSGGVLNVSGRDTVADAMIQLAGGQNAVTGYEGFKPLTAEAALRAEPDVILVTSRGLDEAGGAPALLTHPGLRQTSAAREERIVAMDDLLLLGFGPRLGQAVRELAELLHGDSAVSTTAGTR